MNRTDKFFLGMIVSWPFILISGIVLLLNGVWLATGMVTYCIGSSYGVARVAYEFWQHGIRNDR